ncbi:MAG TPA: 3-isopropylmalate dehydratase small subunit [Polyangia bacterium]|jgi:3-isopropylmalate/(R)-2-methylmalate dehydratase small subunit|nr:3-isopropylmalate dehydratase small subunit [Polyangia bacterium]
MTPVKTVVSRVTPLYIDDVDTDQIIPARFLKTTQKAGLGAQLFNDWRGKQFQPVDGARILLAGENFGCGSSREHAVWALTDAGFAAVVARSFADIFRNNALKNGLVPVAVDEKVHAYLKQARSDDANLQLSIDVATAQLTLPDGEVVSFPLDPFARRCLVEGIDELDYLVRHEADIAAFEARRA